MVKRTVLNLDKTPVLFTVIGISSHENDYRLSWSINNQLGYAFSQGDNLITSDGREFACFVHEGDNQTLLLISNRCDDGFLLPKFKNIDFVLKFNSELNDTQISEWLRDLRKVSLISASFQIPANKKMLQLLR